MNDVPPPTTTREDFDAWLGDMDDAVERFKASLPPDVKQALDGSPQSLDALEAWILASYPDTTAMLASDQAKTVDGAARYIGEVFRRELGGHWDIMLDDAKKTTAYFGLPILTWGPNSTPMAPLTMATASAARRTGTFLQTILQNIRPLLRS